MNAEQIVKELRNCGGGDEGIKIVVAAADLIESLQTQLAQQQSNEPLTLDELRGMEGQPVWVAPKDECCPPHWRIWDNDEPCDTQVFDAYRYKPKEATHAEI